MRLIKYVNRSSCITEYLVTNESKRCRGIWESEQTVGLPALALMHANRVKTHQMKSLVEMKKGRLKGAYIFEKRWFESIEKRNETESEKRKILDAKVTKKMEDLRNIWLKPLQIIAYAAMNTRRQSQETLRDADLYGKKQVGVKKKSWLTPHKTPTRARQQANRQSGDIFGDAILNEKKNTVVRERAVMMLDKALTKHSSEVKRLMTLCKSEGKGTVSPEVMQHARNSFLKAMKISNTYLKAFGLPPHDLVDIKEKLAKAENDGIKSYVDEMKERRKSRNISN